MKRIRATSHQAMLKRLLKQPGFRQGYAKELERLRQRRVNDQIR